MSPVAQLVLDVRDLVKGARLSRTQAAAVEEFGRLAIGTSQLQAAAAEAERLLLAGEAPATPGPAATERWLAKFTQAESAVDASFAWGEASRAASAALPGWLVQQALKASGGRVNVAALPALLQMPGTATTPPPAVRREAADLLAKADMVEDRQLADGYRELARRLLAPYEPRSSE